MAIWPKKFMVAAKAKTILYLLGRVLVNQSPIRAISGKASVSSASNQGLSYHSWGGVFNVLFLSKFHVKSAAFFRFTFYPNGAVHGFNLTFQQI